jgi:heterodisulfide reductase subunit B
MKIAYYPGCTLKADARHFEESAIESFRALGIELEELPRWNCCGTVFSFATDNVMYHLAPVRNLLRVREQGKDTVLTLCSMCFNTLKRANKLFNEDAEKRDKITGIMDNENLVYDGKTQVKHALEILRDEVGLQSLREKVGQGLKGICLAPYYGCMLLRPDGLGIDDAENPTLFQDVLRALGAEAASYPFQGECCGAYQTVMQPEVVGERTYVLVDGARRSGADAIVVSCPLCAFNLDQRQGIAGRLHSDFDAMPVFYITECLHLALGLGFKEEWKRLHHVPVDAFLEKLHRSQNVAGAVKRQRSNIRE